MGFAPGKKRSPRNSAWLMPACAALALCLCPALNLLAVTKPMHFDRLSMEDGLSQTTVNAIVQDTQGFMWFGTEDGLNRYDGYAFTQYYHDRSNPDALISDFIKDLVHDDDGNLWVSTDGGGLARWDRLADRFVRFRHDPEDPTSLPTDRIRGLHYDLEGALWIATRREGLVRFDVHTSTFTHYRHDPADGASLSGDSVFAMESGGDGVLWVGTHNGLNRLDKRTGEVRRYQHDPDDPGSISGDSVRSMHIDHAGVLWVGTARNGLNRFDQEAQTFQRYRHHAKNPTTLSHNRVNAILEDQSRRLWIGTNKGLNRLDRASGEIQRYVHDPADPASLGDDEIVSLYEDRTGILWVGTKSAGLSKWNPRSWSFGHFPPDVLSSRKVSSFAQDGDGTLWVGTFGGGLNVIDRNKNTVTVVKDTLSDGRIMALLHDSEGKLWVGTMNGGLNVLDPATGSVRVFRHDANDPHSLGADGVMSLFQDSNNELWIGTYGGGVSKFEPEKGSFLRFLPDDSDPGSLSSAIATCFAEDRHGGLWIGTDGGGLNLLDVETSTFHHFRHDPHDPSSIGADTVYAVHVDISGRVWIGTRDGGVSRVVGSSSQPEAIRFSNFSHAAGLANDAVYGVLSDQDLQLWLSTNRGLTRFNPATGEFKDFGRSHGLQAEEFNFGAYFRNGAGELFFGGPNGFNVFHPSELESNKHGPRVVLTSYSKFNKEVPTDSPYDLMRDIDLGFRDDVVSFEFAALDFTAPEENRYSYMLEGFDPAWTDLGKRHRVTYTNLDAGNYILRVKAANSDNVWSESGIELGLHVEPAPWETWWAYMLYAMAIVLAIGAAWKQQQRKLAREVEYSHRLEDEVHQRTRELADSNAELQSVNNKLLEASLTDPLTGLRNRRFLFEEVSKDIDLIRRRANSPRKDSFDLVFLMVDLDRFKPINDNSGHEAGDRVLLEICDILRQASRSSDFVIRWGGDEFLVIARQADREQVEALAERIRSQIAKTAFDLGNGEYASTSCSIGYACYPFMRSQPELLTWEQVLGCADRAMYCAKERRDTWVGFLSTDSSAVAHDLYTAIRQGPEALEKQGGLEIRSSDPANRQACA